MADNRLDPDINLLGYWGFDEALETDVAIDGATNFSPADLTVTAATSVQAGRVGSARQFVSTSSAFASVTIARLRLLSDATLMAWVKLSSYNSSGSLLRTILSCGGPTTGDNLNYSVSVDVSGRLVYKHTAATGVVIVRTASATIKIGQFYGVFVRRSANGGNQDIEFFVDNNSIPIFDVTVNAVGSTLPVPPPIANASAIFSVARSQKETDSAYWDGLIDEVSVHDVARAYQPYLRGSYYRIAIRNATARLTAPNNVLSVSSTDIGAGVRWWCYERDQDLYVVKESPFGFFGPDTRLTQTGIFGSATGSKKPELIYDLASDTLLVLFVGGNRIFKLTGSGTDDPSAINMPFTADTGGIIKSLDNADGGSFGNGGGQRQVISEDITYVNRTPVKIGDADPTLFSLGNGGGQLPSPVLYGTGTISSPTINFMQRPSGFGVAIGPDDLTLNGFRVFRFIGGGSILLGTASRVAGAGFYFFLFSTPPIYGDVFYAEVLKYGKPTGVFTNAVVFKNFEPLLEGSIYKIGREGDGTDTANFGNGGGQLDEFVITYVNRTPVKLSSQDPTTFSIGTGGGDHGKVTTTGSNRPGNAAIEVELS